MKRVLFFIRNGWVFGKIHNELIKALYPDLYCDILCWTGSYSNYEFECIKQKYDYFVSTPEGCFALFDQHGVPLKKCIAVLHGDWDVFNPLINHLVSKEYFQQLGGYAAVAPILQNISLTHGIGRVPSVLRIGVFQKNYIKNKLESVNNIGYFAKYTRNDHGYDSKRGFIVDEIASKTQLNLVRNESVHFIGVETLYENIGLMICPSLSEGNPYPMLEAFACGVPVITTPVGIAPEYLKQGGGFLLPMQEHEFTKLAIEKIEEMKSDISLYKKLCNESYEIGKTIDWSIIREEWLNFIYSLESKPS